MNPTLEVCEFNHTRHNSYLVDWWDQRGFPNRSYDSLPSIGFIVPGVAVGFVREVEGKMRILDSFMTNPSAPADMRHSALDLITQNLILISPGYHLMVITEEATVMARAVRFGFTVATSYSVLLKS